jgi:pilus assembly protein Flp/PilA
MGMTALIARFIKDERGLTSIEYGLPAAVIGVGIIVATKALGAKAASTFTNSSNGMK